MGMLPNLSISKGHFLLILFFFFSASSDLSFDFYLSSCPNAEAIVKNTVRSASEADSSVPGKLLRLMFHDCMVEGCDGSVLIQGNGTERSDPANRSVGGFEVVESAKRLLEFFCPATVSCADIVVLAARDAVELTGGPSVVVPMGRRDSRVSQASIVRPNIVDTTFTVDEMMEIFTSKDLSLDDLVTLSGAHTIGLSHCNSFGNRFESDENGKLVPADDSLDEALATELAKQCSIANTSVTVHNDPETGSQFDNQYFINLLDGKGLFSSDAVLASDPRTRSKVKEFSDNQEKFFQSWEESFLKLASIGATTGGDGEVRKSCMVING